MAGADAAASLDGVLVRYPGRAPLGPIDLAVAPGEIGEQHRHETFADLGPARAIVDVHQPERAVERCRRRAAPTDGSDALSPDERQRLDQLLDTKTDD